jgi:chromate transporter
MPISTPLSPHSVPQSRADLFLSFSQLALQGFGGVVAIAQRELVEKKRWLTPEEFLEDWAVAQILPGPNVVNLSLIIGDRYFGFTGAMAALAGMLLFPLLIVVALAALLGGFTDIPVVQGALRGMSAVSAGLIAATGLKLTASLKNNAMGLVVCWFFLIASFIASALFRIPLAAVLLVLGGAAWWWAYRKLASST